MKNKKILALLLACTIMASGVPVYAADFSDGTAESVQDAESSLFGMEDSELTEDTMPALQIWKKMQMLHRLQMEIAKRKI